MATTSRKTLQHPSPAGPPTPPEWLPQTESALEALLKLPAGWDSYGARPIRPELVSDALHLLRSAVWSETPPPAIVPTVHGGVQLEWHRSGIDLEIEIEQPGQFHIFYEEPSKGAELETIVTQADLSRLSELIARLSPEQ